MRIRLLSRPPLGFLKAWYSVPDGTSSSNSVSAPIETIYDLKEVLRESLPAIRQGCPHTANLGLSIDGFELLDSSGLDVIKEGDLVTYAIHHFYQPITLTPRKQINIFISMALNGLSLSYLGSITIHCPQAESPLHRQF